jgi:hypothetical protein
MANPPEEKCRTGRWAAGGRFAALASPVIPVVVALGLVGYNAAVSAGPPFRSGDQRGRDTLVFFVGVAACGLGLVLGLAGCVYGLAARRPLLAAASILGLLLNAAAGAAAFFVGAFIGLPPS